jgi:hypothetical protein
LRPPTEIVESDDNHDLDLDAGSIEGDADSLCSPLRLSSLVEDPHLTDMELLNAYVDTIDPLLPTFPTHDLLRLTGYVNAAHATDLKTRRSVSGYVFTLAGGAVAFKSKLQATVATSSTEVEFVAAVSKCCKGCQVSSLCPS